MGWLRALRAASPYRTRPTGFRTRCREAAEMKAVAVLGVGVQGLNHPAMGDSRRHPLLLIVGVYRDINRLAC